MSWSASALKNSEIWLDSAIKNPLNLGIIILKLHLILYSRARFYEKRASNNKEEICTINRKDKILRNEKYRDPR